MTSPDAGRVEEIRAIARQHIRVIAAEDGVWGIDVHGTWMPFEDDPEARVREIAENIIEQQTQALIHIAEEAEASAEGYRRRLSEERENHLVSLRLEVVKRQEAEADVAQLQAAMDEAEPRLQAEHEAVLAATPFVNLCRQWFDGTDLVIQRAAQREEEPSIGDLLRAASLAIDKAAALARARGK